MKKYSIFVLSLASALLLSNVSAVTENHGKLSADMIPDHLCVHLGLQTCGLNSGPCASIHIPGQKEALDGGNCKKFSDGRFTAYCCDNGTREKYIVG